MTILKALFQLHLISPRGLSRLLCSVVAKGPNLMALLHFARKYHANLPAAEDDTASVTYGELYQRSEQYARALDIAPGTPVALIGKNSIDLVCALYALSACNARVYLMHTSLSSLQILSLCREKAIELCLCDAKIKEKLQAENIRILSLDDLKIDVQNSVNQQRQKRRGGHGSITVLTGGSSGKIKAATRHYDPFNFLPPFFALLKDIGVHRYKQCLLAPPIYHGFGLSALIVTLLMGKCVHLSTRFSAESMAERIKKRNIDLLVAVPTMLNRLTALDDAALPSLQCILSGSAPLNEKLVRQVEACFGNHVLHNLYGSSEAGFFVMAKPEDLHRFPLCSGRVIRGVKTMLKDTDEQGIGTLYVKTSAAMSDLKSQWQSTGDRFFVDHTGLLFFKGRNDDMIVSGGENIYPQDVEKELLEYPEIKEVSVYGVACEDFGQKLEAVYVSSREIDEDSLKKWLKLRLASYQVPHRFIRMHEIPYRETGKIVR